jgi:hypothetical protein
MISRSLPCERSGYFGWWSETPHSALPYSPLILILVLILIFFCVRRNGNDTPTNCGSNFLFDVR